MAKLARKKAAAKRKSARKPKILESISGSDALLLLKVLADRDQNLAKEIDAVARELLGRVEIDEIAAQVQMELELLHVEDVWDRAGATRYGYVDPGDSAWEMFDEALERFREEVRKYKQRSMLKESELFCHGILKGIYDFDKESSTEFKQWAADAPGEYFGQILDDWKKLVEGRPSLSSMRDFLQSHCPDWAEWAMKSLDRAKR